MKAKGDSYWGIKSLSHFDIKSHQTLLQSLDLQGNTDLFVSEKSWPEFLSSATPLSQVADKLIASFRA